MRRSSVGGFTLIELIVTMVVGAIIAGIATVSYTAVRQNVIGVEPQQALRGVAVAEAFNYRDRGTYIDIPTGAPSNDPTIVALTKLENQYTYIGRGNAPVVSGSTLQVSVAAGTVTSAPATGSVTGPAVGLAAVSRTGVCYTLVSFPDSSSATVFPEDRLASNYGALTCTGAGALSAYNPSAPRGQW